MFGALIFKLFYFALPCLNKLLVDIFNKVLIQGFCLQYIVFNELDEIMEVMVYRALNKLFNRFSEILFEQRTNIFFISIILIILLTNKSIWLREKRQYIINARNIINLLQLFCFFLLWNLLNKLKHIFSHHW